MADLGSPRQQRLERLRGPPLGIPFEGLAARLHQRDDRAGEVLAQDDRRDDREHRHDVRGEAPPQHAAERLHHERSAAGQQRGQKHPLPHLRGGKQEPGGEPDYEPGTHNDGQWVRLQKPHRERQNGE